MEQTGLHALRLVVQASNNPDGKSLDNWARCYKERVNMSDTREKLQESEYFLGLMTLTQAERDTFKYNLSAFLSASRSVTLIMQKEYDRISGFKR